MMAGSVRDLSNGGGPRRVPVPVWAARAAAACWAALKKTYLRLVISLMGLLY